MPRSTSGATVAARPARPLTIDWQDSGGATVLRLHGPLVAAADADLLVMSVRSLLTASPLPLVCDLSDVDAIGVRGMSALIVAQEDVRRTGRHLVLLKPSDNLRLLIDKLHLTDWVDIAVTEALAIRRAVDWRLRSE